MRVGERVDEAVGLRVVAEGAAKQQVPLHSVDHGSGCEYKGLKSFAITISHVSTRTLFHTLVVKTVPLTLHFDSQRLLVGIAIRNFAQPQREHRRTLPERRAPYSHLSTSFRRSVSHAH